MEDEMDRVEITLTIDYAAAIRAGKTEYGRVTVPVAVSDLTDAQREELIYCLRHAITPGTTPIAEPSTAAIARALDENRAARLEREAQAVAKSSAWLAARPRAAFNPERGLMEICPQKPDEIDYQYENPIVQTAYSVARELRDYCDALNRTIREMNYLADEAAKQAKQARTAAETQRLAQKRAWLQQLLDHHGTLIQAARFRDNLMPIDEADEIAETILFRDLSESIAYDDADCERNIDTLTDDQYVAYSRLREQIGNDTSITPVQITGPTIGEDVTAALLTRSTPVGKYHRYVLL